MTPPQPFKPTRAWTATRPVTIVVAVICLVLSSLSSLATALCPGISLPVVVLSIVIGVTCLIAAVGLWALHHWAMSVAIVAIVITVLNALSGSPGLFTRSTAGAAAGAGTCIALAVLVIVLVLLPSARRAFR